MSTLWSQQFEFRHFDFRKTQYLCRPDFAASSMCNVCIPLFPVTLCSVLCMTVQLCIIVKYLFLAFFVKFFWKLGSQTLASEIPETQTGRDVFFFWLFCSQSSGWPDWENFRMLGGCLLWIDFLKITEIAQILGLLFYGKICALIFTRNGLGYILCDFFTNGQPGHPVRVIYCNPSTLQLFFSLQMHFKKLKFPCVFLSFKIASFSRKNK
jgi:hypothetical protein